MELFFIKLYCFSGKIATFFTLGNPGNPMAFKRSAGWLCLYPGRMGLAIISKVSDPLAYCQGELGNRLNAFAAELNAFFDKGHAQLRQQHTASQRFLSVSQKPSDDPRRYWESENRHGGPGTDSTRKTGAWRALLREEENAKERTRDRRQNIALAVLSLFSLFATFMDLNNLIDALFKADIQLVLQQLLDGNAQVIAQLATHDVVLATAAVCWSAVSAPNLKKRTQKTISTWPGKPSVFRAIFCMLFRESPLRKFMDTSLQTVTKSCIIDLSV